MYRKVTSSVIRRFNKQVSFKIILSIMLLQLLTCSAFAVLGYVVNGKQSDRLQEQFDHRLETEINLAGAAIASGKVAPDTIDSSKHPVYRSMKDELERIKAENHLENVYVLSKQEGKEQIVILTGLDEDYGTEYPFTPDMNAALDQGKKVISSIYTDEYGIHKSVFLPVKNSKGEYQCILGIDLDASVVPNTSRTMLLVTLSISVIVLLIGFVITTAISRIFTSPIRHLMLASERMAEGDLTERIEAGREDEIGKLSSSFDRMCQNLRGLIVRIFTASEQIAATSTQLYQTADESSTGAQQVAGSMSAMSDSIAEVVASITESTSSIRCIDHELEKVKEGMQGMQEVVRHVGSQSNQGQQKVEQTLNQMTMIQDAMQQSHQAAQQLENRSEEISSIIQIITEISQQTNLLALNAAIEAARVGEMGRGFAVVADEVKKLADQSAQAATSVSQLVNGTQNDSRLVMLRIKEGSQAVGKGHEWMKETYVSFKDIFEGVHEIVERTDRMLAAVQSVKASFGTIADSMQRISDSTEEQAAGTEQVTAVAQQQSAAMQEITSAIHMLSNMADELQQSVNQFRTV